MSRPKIPIAVLVVRKSGYHLPDCALPTLSLHPFQFARFNIQICNCRSLILGTIMFISEEWLVFEKEVLKQRPLFTGTVEECRTAYQATSDNLALQYPKPSEYDVNERKWKATDILNRTNCTDLRQSGRPLTAGSDCLFVLQLRHPESSSSLWPSCK